MYQLLALIDFDPNNYKNLDLPKCKIKNYKNYLVPIKKGDIFNFIEKIDWWIVIERIDEGDVEKVIVPSSILVPIKNDINVCNINISDLEKSEIIPNIGKKEKKYFPLIFKFYKNVIPLEENPIGKSNFLSRIFYSWVTKYIILGYHRYLVEGDLWSPQDDTTNQISIHYSQEFHEKTVIGVEISLVKVFISYNKLSIFSAFFIKFIQDIVKFLTPFLIRQFITYSQDPKRELYIGIIMCISLFFAKLIESICLNKYLEYVNLLGCDFRCLIASLVNKKIFKIRSDYLNIYPQSFLTNLIAIDSYRIQESFNSVFTMQSCVLQFILCFIYLYFVFGISFLAGVGIIVIIMPLTFVLANLSKTIEAKQMKFKDQRLKLINTILQGIKIIKLYAWEDEFEKMIKNVRKQELVKLGLSNTYNNLLYTFLSLSPTFITISTFYAFIYFNGHITAQVAFESLSIFTILRMPVTFLPESVRQFITARVAYSRIIKFLSLPETEQQERAIGEEKYDKPELIVTNADFTFSAECLPFLNNININFSPGTLHIFIGENGAGKSTLFRSLLKETILLQGNVIIKGRMNYVPQLPWIRNATVFQNIVDDNQFDAEKYKTVIELCQLEQDLKLLPHGDRTEIGEKGVNLSGGQKQRVGLARAVYSNSDIYLFDDPFSNLDKTVGHKIFCNLLSSNGYLSKSINVLITHDDFYLKYADCIHVMKNGKILISGDLKILEESHINIQEFLSPIHVEAIDQIESPEDSVSIISDGTGEKLKKLSDNQLIDEDVLLKGKVKSSIYFTYIKSHSVLLFFLVVLFTGIYLLLITLSNIYIGNVTSQVLYKHNSTNFFIIYGSFTGAQIILSVLMAIVKIWGSILASKRIHNKLLATLFTFPVTFFESNPVGRLLNAFSKEISIVDDNISRSIRFFVYLIFAIGFNLLGVIYFLPYLLIEILLLIIVFHFIQLYYIKSSRQIQRLESISRAPILSFLIDTIQGLSVIKSLKREQKFSEDFDIFLEFNSIPFKMNVFFNRWLGIRLELISNILIFASSVSILVICFVSYINSGVVGFILFTTTSITQLISYMILTKSDMENYIVSIERIAMYFDIQPEDNNDYLIHPDPDWPRNGKIIFRDYSCCYRSHLPNVLHEISFTINPNERIGVVGRTGSGKSSLILSLFRMINKTNGNIFIDDINISEIDIKTLRKSLTIIPQDAFVFDGSLRKNIDPYDEHDDEEIYRALELSQLKDLVNSLPDGLNYVINEFGNNISSGEKQRLCLARALLKHTKILILDEATSNIDLKTDQIIQDTIRTQFSDCTIITVAHRIDTIITYDRILVLDEGRVVDFDSPENLLRKSDSIFARMASHAIPM